MNDSSQAGGRDFVQRPDVELAVLAELGLGVDAERDDEVLLRVVRARRNVLGEFLDEFGIELVEDDRAFAAVVRLLVVRAEGPVRRAERLEDHNFR